MCCNHISAHDTRDKQHKLRQTKLVVIESSTNTFPPTITVHLLPCHRVNTSIKDWKCHSVQQCCPYSNIPINTKDINKPHRDCTPNPFISTFYTHFQVHCRRQQPTYPLLS